MAPSTATAPSPAPSTLCAQAMSRSSARKPAQIGPTWPGWIASFPPKPRSRASRALSLTRSASSIEVVTPSSGGTFPASREARTKLDRAESNASRAWAQPTSAQKSMEPKASRIIPGSAAISKVSLSPRAVSMSATMGRHRLRSPVNLKRDLPISALGRTTPSIGSDETSATSSVCHGLSIPLIPTSTA